jgi:hypothetical protein
MLLGSGCCVWSTYLCGWVQVGNVSSQRGSFKAQAAGNVHASGREGILKLCLRKGSHGPLQI